LATLSALASVDEILSLAMTGTSLFFIDPTKVTIVNFSRGPQIPASAKPLTVPTIRITPPGPPAPSLSVGTAQKRDRRKGL
jgi:hypothetical protein